MLKKMCVSVILCILLASCSNYLPEITTSSSKPPENKCTALPAQAAAEDDYVQLYEKLTDEEIIVVLRIKDTENNPVPNLSIYLHSTNIPAKVAKSFGESNHKGEAFFVVNRNVTSSMKVWVVNHQVSGSQGTGSLLEIKMNNDRKQIEEIIWQEATPAQTVIECTKHIKMYFCTSEGQPASGLFLQITTLAENEKNSDYNRLITGYTDENGLYFLAEPEDKPYYITACYPDPTRGYGSESVYEKYKITVSDGTLQTFIYDHPYGL